MDELTRDFIDICFKAEEEDVVRCLTELAEQADPEELVRLAEGLNEAYYDVPNPKFP